MEENRVEESWGCELSGRDLVIPKLGLMQAISKEVKDEHCRAGDILDMSKKQVVAKRGEKFPFVVFQHWREMWTVQGPKGAERIVARHAATPENESLPWKDVDQEGRPFSRQLVLAFYVLPVNDIEGIPYRLYFTKTSINAGRVLSTELAILQRKGKPPASKVFLLGVELVKKDNNDYYVLTVQPERDAQPNEIGAARTWYGTLKSPVMALPPGSGSSEPQQLPPASVATAESEEEVPF